MTEPIPPDDDEHSTLISDGAARDAINVLSLAIVRMIEEIHPEAVLDYLRAPDGRTERFAQIGADVVTLAAAIQVFQRMAATELNRGRVP